MASKAAIEKGEQRSAKLQEPGALKNVSESAAGLWSNATGFLSDVRAEMRKVVAPSRKEVRVTTSVVIVAVFIFGVYFAVVDWIFRVGMNSLLGKLGGMQ